MPELKGIWELNERVKNALGCSAERNWAQDHNDAVDLIDEMGDDFEAINRLCADLWEVHLCNVQATVGTTIPMAICAAFLAWKEQQ